MNPGDWDPPPRTKTRGSVIPKEIESTEEIDSTERTSKPTLEQRQRRALDEADKSSTAKGAVASVVRGKRAQEQRQRLCGLGRGVSWC